MFEFVTATVEEVAAASVTVVHQGTKILSDTLVVFLAQFVEGKDSLRFRKDVLGSVRVLVKKKNDIFISTRQ